MQQIRLDNVRKYVRDLADKQPKQFSALYPQANPLAIDLLSRLLVFETANRYQLCLLLLLLSDAAVQRTTKKSLIVSWCTTRLTVHQALEHTYLATLHCPEDEVTLDCGLVVCLPNHL